MVQFVAQEVRKDGKIPHFTRDAVYEIIREAKRRARPMAKSFAEVLLELAQEDPRICGVSCDCWGFLGPLAQEFPERAVEVGIAEQNLIGVAAGMALRGKVPFAIGMNPFVTMRCFEQIRTDLGYGARNVKVL